MSDSGRAIGDCRHGRTRDYCPDCLRDERDAWRNALVSVWYFTSMDKLQSSSDHIQAIRELVEIAQEELQREVCARYRPHPGPVREMKCPVCDKEWPSHVR